MCPEQEMAEKRKLTVCLAGNPNSGKTTIFNNLTGARQKVGNYPGVTVEKVEGRCFFKDIELRIVDLPGTYSLTARSLDEEVARDFIIEAQPDVIIHIIDGTSLERSLYLTTQIAELNVPLVVALNMSDALEKEGIMPDLLKLKQSFGIEFIPTVGHRRKGMDEMLEAAIRASERKTCMHPDLGPHLQEYRRHMVKILSGYGEAIGPFRLEWLASKLLEGEHGLLKRTGLQEPDRGNVLEAVSDFRSRLEQETGKECINFIAEQRYGYIKEGLEHAYHRSRGYRLSASDKIDKIVINRFLGLPIFGLIMFLVFYFSVDFASPLIDAVDGLFSGLSAWITRTMAPGILRDLLADGIIGGVGGVMVFVPQIMILFFCITLLEASGYMSRASFVVDKLMNKLGLHGNSFIPMLLGFGCTVPAIMACRTLDNRKDRLTTMLASTFMSCGARFPVYLLITGALFSRKNASYAIFAVYLLGVAVAILTAKIFRKYVYRGEASVFIMELPPYRRPTLRAVTHQMWNKASGYIKKAGTVILAAAIVFWFLANFPKLSPGQNRIFEKRIAAAKADYSAVLSRIAAAFGVDKKTEATLLADGVFSETLKLVSSGRTNGKYSPIVRQRAGLVRKYLRANKMKTRQLQLVEFDRIAASKKNSYAGRVGSFLSPLFKPMGLDNWRISLSLISGFVAKEIIVGTLGGTYSLGEDSNEGSVSLRSRILHDPFFQQKSPVPASAVVLVDGHPYLGKTGGTPLALRKGFYYRPSILVAFSFMIFVLLYLPCQAVLGVFVKEAGWKNALIMVGYTTAVAYLLSTVFYQAGKLLGLG